MHVWYVRREGTDLFYGAFVRLGPEAGERTTSDWHRCVELCNKIIKFVYVRTTRRTVDFLCTDRTGATTPDFIFGRAQKRTTDEWANRGSSILCRLSVCLSSLLLWKYEYPVFIAGQLLSSVNIRRVRACACACDEQKSQNLSEMHFQVFVVLFATFLRSLFLYYFMIRLNVYLQNIYYFT